MENYCHHICVTDTSQYLWWKIMWKIQSGPEIFSRYIAANKLHKNNKFKIEFLQKKPQKPLKALKLSLT